MWRKNMLDEIEHLIGAGHYREAISLCRDELSHKPEEPQTLYLLAVAHYKCEEYIETTQALERIIETHPDDVSALLFLARMSSWGYGDGYSRAIDIYRHVLALNEKEINAYIGLALTRRSPETQISIEESIGLLEQALRIDPSRPEVHNNLAYAYWEAGEYQQAKKHFEKLLELSALSIPPNVIKRELEAINKRQRPQNVVYVGPSLPLVD
jgi:tetratricopeptide (TPR) repeat protein